MDLLDRLVVEVTLQRAEPGDSVVDGTGAPASAGTVLRLGDQTGSASIDMVSCGLSRLVNRGCQPR